MSDNTDKPQREMNSAEKKSALLSSAQGVQQKIKDLQLQLQMFSPQAKSLVVTKDLEKLLRSAEKVQMGLQELVL